MRDEWVIAREDSEEPLSEAEWLLAVGSDPEFEGDQDFVLWTAHPDGELRSFAWDESDGHVVFSHPDPITLAKAHGLATLLRAAVCELRPLDS